jgi:hypothetical protein
MIFVYLEHLLTFLPTFVPRLAALPRKAMLLQERIVQNSALHRMAIFSSFVKNAFYF